MIKAALTFLSGVIQAYNQARALWNAPEVQKAKVAQIAQDHRDAWRELNAKLADPNASKKEHVEALKQLRLAQS